MLSPIEKIEEILNTEIREEVRDGEFLAAHVAYDVFHLILQELKALKKEN